MDTSSTPEGTGITEAQAAERFVAMLNPEEVDGETDETGAEETQAEDVDAEGEEPEAEADEEESDEQEDDAESEAQPDDATPIKFKVGDEDVEVTLHELKRGFLREQDYTRKTQALSEQSKALAAERQAERAEFAPLAERTKAIIGQLEQSLRTPLYSEQDMAELRYSNPAEWSARRAEMDEHSRWVEGILAHKDTLTAYQQQQQAQASQAEIQEAARKAGEELRKLRPEWSDEKTRKEAQALISAYGAEIGIGADEWGDISLDARALVALHDAAQWRALKAKTPKVQAKLQAVKTAAPGTKSQAPSKVTDVTRARQRLAKTGREADAAAVFMKLLPD